MDLIIKPRQIFIYLSALVAATAVTNISAQDGPTLTEELEVQPQRYRVEFIIFANNDFDRNEEHLNVIPANSLFVPKNVIPVQRILDAQTLAAIRNQIEGPIVPEPLPPGSEEIIPSIPTLDFRQLLPDELVLADSIERLELLDAYTPLLHAGWEQNELTEDLAIPVNLSEFTAENLAGTLRLHVSRYLHMTLDIAYSDPRIPTNQPVFGFRESVGGFPTQLETDNPLNRYYLYAKRRILRGELNYFDHPAFGLLLQITLPPEPEEEAVDSTATAPSI